jgi:hypothetical protein
VVANLPVGYKLLIKVPLQSSFWDNSRAAVKTSEQVVTVSKEYSTYEVQPKETLYSLSKSLEWDELIALNPIIKKSRNRDDFKGSSKTVVVPQVKKRYTSLTPK